jgi:type VI secretion system protein ImpK
MAGEAETRPRLGELCAEVLAFAFQLKATKDPGGSAEEIKQKVVHMLSDFEQAARSGGFKAEPIAHAKYALAAYVDELVQGSSLAIKDEWAGSPLQLELFNDFAAGEEFYNKLKLVRAGGDADSKEAASVFFLCLTHGFKGMYIDLRGMEERRALMEQLAADLKSTVSGDPKELSPSWKPPDELPKLVRTAPVWLTPVICAVLVVLVVLALAITANILADGAVDTLGGG